jgi:hypothetical protein
VIKLIGTLATASDRVDRSIALGEAVPRLERLKTAVLVGLFAACVLLTIGYVNVTNQINAIREQQVMATQQRATIIAKQKRAEADRDLILKVLSGK